MKKVAGVVPSKPKRVAGVILSKPTFTFQNVTGELCWEMTKKIILTVLAIPPLDNHDRCIFEKSLPSQLARTW